MDPKYYEERKQRIQERAKEKCTHPDVCDPCKLTLTCGTCYARNYYRYGWWDNENLIQQEGYRAYFDSKKAS